jgi:hypothetical protein
MKKSILDEALAISRRNKSKHPELEHFLHYSFIIQENKIVEFGLNNKGVPHRHYGYHDRIKDHRYSPKTHSEIAAYRKARGILDKRKNFQIVNVRINKAGDVRNSKPCSCCYAIMKALGCSRFFYSSDVGFLSCT